MAFAAIILAAGEAIRLNGVRKQLIPLPDGETLLGRQVRQVLARGGTPLVATHHPELIEYARFMGVDVLIPWAHRWTVETLHSTMSAWSHERTIILLGDVVYSKAVMDDITRPTHMSFQIWGNAAEVFALSFITKFWTTIELGLRESIVMAHEGSAPGKLRSFYNVVHPQPTWTVTHDYTRDFDLPQHVRDFRREVLQTGGLDDRRPHE